MNLVDANVLIYAVNSDDKRHRSANRWLDGALAGQEPVAFAWVAVLAFIRLVTRRGIFPSPLSVDEAVELAGWWMSAPAAVVVEPTTRHMSVLAGLLREAGTGGNLVTDAHLASLALEHDATVVTYDADFERFGVRWMTP